MNGLRTQHDLSMHLRRRAALRRASDRADWVVAAVAIPALIVIVAAMALGGAS